MTWLNTEQIKSLVARTGQKIDLNAYKKVRVGWDMNKGPNQGEAFLVRAIELLAPHLPLPRCYKHPQDQFIFDGEHKWRLDAAWPEIQLGIEVQGDIHKYINLRTRDCNKINDLQIAGWLILTFTSQQCEEDPQHVVDNILAAWHHKGGMKWTK